jgi:hypothetical protein
MDKEIEIMWKAYRTIERTASDATEDIFNTSEDLLDVVLDLNAALCRLQDAWFRHNLPDNVILIKDRR